MIFFTFGMTAAAKILCVVVTPFGKYRSTRLPMGIKHSLDMAQAYIEQLLSEFEECEVFFGDEMPT